MSPHQIKLLRRIAEGERATCKEWRTTRALEQRGLIERTFSYPFADILTEKGRRAISESRETA
jgi:hypothetical protein